MFLAARKAQQICGDDQRTSPPTTGSHSSGRNYFSCVTRDLVVCYIIYVAARSEQQSTEIGFARSVDRNGCHGRDRGRFCWRHRCCKIHRANVEFTWRFQPIDSDFTRMIVPTIPRHSDLLLILHVLRIVPDLKLRNHLSTFCRMSPGCRPAYNRALRKRTWLDVTTQRHVTHPEPSNPEPSFYEAGTGPASPSHT